MFDNISIVGAGKWGGGAGILTAPPAFGAPERANLLVFMGTSALSGYVGYRHGMQFVRGKPFLCGALGLLFGFALTELLAFGGYLPAYFVGQTVFVAHNMFEGLLGGPKPITMTLNQNLDDLASGTARSSDPAVSFSTPLRILIVQPLTTKNGPITAIQLRSPQGQTGWTSSSSLSSRAS